MRKEIKVHSCFYPLPVLLISTYDKDGNPNAMNAAWGGVYDDNQITICLSTNHKTTDNIKLKKEFTVSFATALYVKEADYLGIESGNNVNKIKKANLHVLKSELVDAPIIDEFPLAIECKLVNLQDDGTTTHVVADIVGVNVDDSVLTNGKIDVAKLRPIAFDPSANTYYEINKVVGKAFFDGLEIKKN